jgi:hypothetical protein
VSRSRYFLGSCDRLRLSATREADSWQNLADELEDDSDEPDEVHHELPIFLEQLGEYLCSIFLFSVFFFVHWHNFLISKQALYCANDGDGEFINVRTPPFKPVTQQ